MDELESMTLVNCDLKSGTSKSSKNPGKAMKNKFESLQELNVSHNP